MKSENPFKPIEAVVDRFGRILIPKTIRKKWGLSAGTQMTIEEEFDGLKLHSVQGTCVKFREKGFLVADVAPLESLETREVLERIRNERHLMVSKKGQT